MHRISGRQKKDRHFLAFLAQSRKNGSAIDLRQHHVEHNQIVGDGTGQMQTIVALRRHIDHEAILRQSLAQESGDLGLVLNDQYPRTENP
jgi:hypothetical protein